MRPLTVNLRHYSLWMRARPPWRYFWLHRLVYHQPRRDIVLISGHSKRSRSGPSQTPAICPDPLLMTLSGSSSLNSAYQDQSDQNIADESITNSLNHTPYNNNEVVADSIQGSIQNSGHEVIKSPNDTPNVDMNPVALEQNPELESEIYLESDTNYQTASPEIIDLVQQYDNVLNEIVNDHLALFQLHFTSQLQQETNESLPSPYNIIKIASNQINSNYLEVRAKRSKIRRSICSASLYNNFLRQLYWMEDGGPPNPKYVFQAYKKLPYPPPRSINPVHLESLISFFMGHASDKDPSMYLTILSDIAECGMPISIQEHSVALNILGKQLDNPAKKHHAQALLEEQIGKLKSQGSLGGEINTNPETSHITSFTALNALLGVALKSGRSSSTVEKVLAEFKGGSDRFTRLIMLSFHGKKRNGREVKTQYRNIIESGDIIDMPVLNLVMKCFLQCGYVDEAEVMFQRLLQQAVKPKKSQLMGFKSYNGIEPQLRNRVIIMDYLLHIVRLNKIDTSHRYSVPLLPDYYTYGNFFYYYCMTSGNFNKCIEILRIMTDQGGCLPDKHFFLSLYEAFHLHHHNMANEWNLQRLNYVTELLCHYETIQSDRHGEHFCTTNIARSALRSYRTLAPSLSEWFDKLEGELNRKGSRKRFYNVYTVLRKLSETPLVE